MHRCTAIALLAFGSLALPGCVALDYDLATVPVPLSAKPAAEGLGHERISIKARNTLWLHGLLGQDMPDVSTLLTEASAGADGVADLRITQAGSFHDWLLTHLTATLVRMKTVTIEGQLVRDR